ncbi:MAG: thiolase family protein [Thermoleophilia bacterium]
MTAVIVDAVRTPVARIDGDLRELTAQALAAALIGAAVERSGLDPARIDEVIMASATEPQGNLARRAVLDAGLPAGVPATTIDRQCGGGLDAIRLAVALVAAGDAEVVLAGGVESATNSPMRAETGRDTRRTGGFFPRAAFSGGGFDDPGMAESAETIAAEHGITRVRQDRFAADSHARAAEASAGGVFADEIVPITRHGVVIEHDSCPRPRLTEDRMARVPALLHGGGTVTAGNSSQLADGGAMALVCTPNVARRLGRPGLSVVASATAGVDPRVCGLGAVAAADRLAEHHPRLVAAEADTVAFTEAFAAQVLATIDGLSLDPERVNPHGGSVGLGHPWAASGAIQVVRLFTDIARRRRYVSGLALAAIAGGLGTAMWVERWGPG